MMTKLDADLDDAIAAPPHKKSHTGFLVLLFVVGAALAAAVVYELGIRKTQDKALASTLTEDRRRGRRW